MPLLMVGGTSNVDDTSDDDDPSACLLSLSLRGNSRGAQPTMRSFHAPVRDDTGAFTVSCFTAAPDTARCYRARLLCMVVGV